MENMNQNNQGYMNGQNRGNQPQVTTAKTNAVGRFFKSKAGKKITLIVLGAATLAFGGWIATKAIKAKKAAAEAEPAPAEEGK